MSSVVSRIHAMPKAGGAADEYEDAATVREEEWPVRAAIADGATESVFAHRWAEILVEGLCAGPATPEYVAGALSGWQKTWASRLEEQTEDVPWYVAAKARQGAFAAVLGLEVQEAGRWRAVAMGDSVLFHLRGETLRRAWPYTEPADLSNRPVLMPSRPALADPPLQTAAGKWRPGDTFLLATDAVAAWLLRGDQLAGLDWTEEAFREAVDAARAAGRLRNDDATLLLLHLPGRDPEDPP